MPPAERSSTATPPALRFAPPVTRLRQHMPPRQWTLPALALLLLAVVACGRAIDRPLRGAAPGTEAPATAGVPPTLQPSEALRFKPLPSPSPATSAVASPSAQPAPPI